MCDSEFNFERFIGVNAVLFFRLTTLLNHSTITVHRMEERALYTAIII